MVGNWRSIEENLYKIRNINYVNGLELILVRSWLFLVLFINLW